MKKNIFAKSETEYPYSIVLQPSGLFKVIANYTAVECVLRSHI